ncbi:MAG: hydantoinase/oxoprolinase family protein [Erysipelotrichales bacterium]
MKYRVGIDVGGTNTDAIIIDENNMVVSKYKTFTTKDIFSGINDALKEVIKQSVIDVKNITHAMLGTTQCTNAIVERKKLEKVVSIRLAGPATRAVHPYANWPSDIKELINQEYYIAEGGFEYDGTPIKNIDKEEIENIVKVNIGNCHNYAISCVFAPISGSQEEEVRNIIKNIDPNANVSISSEIGSLSLLERENATILNAALVNVIKNVVSGFKEALKKEKINGASIYLCQNDGTLMDVEYALKFPVLTIASGPTNSIRGGIYLSKEDTGIILDVGVTTSDIGVVVNGFPRETSIESSVGGVTTNFRMPDIVSISIGGGTIVREDELGNITIGPDSVGYSLSQEALIFGGKTITLSDIAIKLGMAKFGDETKLKDLDELFAQKVMGKVKSMIEDSIDLVSTSRVNENLIVVGGGSSIVPKEYSNITNVLVPDNFEVANAIGASIAKVSGNFEGIISFAKTPREEAIANSKEIAITNAIKAGAAPNSVEIIEVEEFPIAYHPEDAVRIKIKAVGELEHKY